MPDLLVRDALRPFRAAYGLDEAGYAARRFVVGVGPVRLVLPNPGLLKFHDLHHIALGAPLGLLGEAEVSVLELRGGAPTALITALCLGSIAIGALLAPRRVLGWWRRSRGCRNLYGERYEELLGLRVSELAARVSPPPPRRPG